MNVKLKNASLLSVNMFIYCCKKSSSSSFSYISISDYVCPSSEIMLIKVNAKLTISYMVNKLLHF